MVETPVNLENEKKKNLKLALAVASLGVLGFFALYIIFFLSMFFSPFLLFSFLPFPSFSKDVVGLDGNLLIFSETVNFKGATYEEPPQEKMTLRIYNGESISEPEEIQSFFSLYPAENKIYFFDKGLYRTFDMKKWEEFKNPEIGSNPKGAVGTEGIWVLSTVMKKPLLKLITESETKEMPLPDINFGDISVCSSQILCLGNELYLFLENNDTLILFKYDGKQWSKPEMFENRGKNKAIVFKDGIIFVSYKSVNKQTEFSLRVYDGNSWSEPKVENIRGTFFNTIPAVFKGRPIVFQQGFFSEKYHFLDGGRIKGPFSIRKSFFPAIDLWKVLFVSLVSNIIFFLFVFLLSFLIRKYKLKTWRIDTREYEFASLFRRFLAKSIDFFLIMIPACIPLYFVLKEDLFFETPFKFIGLFFYSFGMMVLGIFLYHSLLEGTWGKTIGKKICGIVVLNEDFTKCTIGRGFLRNLMRIVDNFFYYLVGVVAMAGTMRWQRLGDLVAGTVVVKDKRR